MNMFNLDVTQRCLIAECWCPVEALEEIQVTLSHGTVSGCGLLSIDKTNSFLLSHSIRNTSIL